MTWTTQGIIDQARHQLNDFETPYAWHDYDYIFYANEIINILCRDMRLILDSTTVSTSRIVTVAGTMDYVLSPSIIYVASAKVVEADTSKELIKVTFAEMDNQHPNWRQDDNDEMTYYMLDYRTGYITFKPTPDAVYNVWLSTIRYPLTPLTIVTPSQIPEIPETYALPLLYGICYLAYLKWGDRTYDPNKSAVFYKLFRDSIVAKKVENLMFRGVERTAEIHRGFI